MFKRHFGNIWDSELNRSMVIITAILLICLPFADSFKEFQRDFFCQPAAFVCSMFFNCPYTATSEGYMLELAGLPVHITLQCSAVKFFILTFALSVAAIMRSFGDIAKLLWVLPFAYAITILANCARIITGWLTGRLARAFLPENLWPSVHLYTGVAVFMVILFAAYIFLLWSLNNGHTRTKTPDS